MATFLGNLADTLNGYIWAMPLIYLCLGGGLIFTIALRGVQVRHLGDMTRLLFNGQKSQSGLSSFQAFCMAIAGRVGTGNIAGVATAIFYGGPGALFWMWMVAILGAATTFIECTMAQLFKEKVNNQYRGGATYYISKFFKSGALGYIFSVVAMISLALTQTGIHSNTIAESVLAAFSIPKWITALVICVALAAIIFGGVKRIGAVAEKVVPVMAGIYIIVALIVLVLNISQVPAVFKLVFTSAFGKDQIIGAAFGSAVIWGTKRAVFSSETGMSTATQAAATAEVSHPVKQGLVQAFSVYIDTLFVCTATGIMLLMTGCYNVTDGAGGLLAQNVPTEVSAGAPWVQMALDTHFSWGSAFIAIAMTFFGFTTIMNNYYSSETHLAFFWHKKEGGMPKWAFFMIRLIVVAFTFIGAIISTGAIWNWSDTTLGIMTWMNMIAVACMLPLAIKLLKDFESQQKLGLDPVFDPDKFNIPGTELWREIRDKFKAGELKN